MNDERPTHLDLFSGIGGFAIAAGRAGFRTIGFSEIEPYACQILGRHWPDVPNWGDIRNLPTWWLRGLDLLTGGFPCQPYSLAGKRGGSRDNRALWPKMFRVIAETRPTWVLGENVPGLINLELDRVLSDLESLDYTCWPLVIPACAVDARHRRDRVWVIAHAHRGRAHGEHVGLSRSADTPDTEWNGALRDVAHTAGVGRCEGSNGRQQGFAVPELGGEESASLAHADQTGRGEQRGRHPMGPQHPAAECGSEDVADTNKKRTGRLSSRAEAPHASFGFSSEPLNHQPSTLNLPSEWPTEPRVGRVVNGLPHRSHRLKGLGNAIVPQVAEVLLRAIHAQLRP